LESVDPILYKYFDELLSYTDEEIEAMDLTFSVVVDDFGTTKEYPLIPNGSEVSVTRSNLYKYISKYAAWRMFDSVEPQIRSFLEGFYDVLPPQCTCLFTEWEMSNLLGGAVEINVDDWKSYTIWEDLGKERKEWFFEIVRDFDQTQRSMLVQFTTGTAHIPAFRYLYPPFSVGSLFAATDGDLPVGHTCFNRLELPFYSSKERMREKILTALNFGATGFGEE